MIKIENTVVPSAAWWEGVIRGARNPMNSWDKSDSWIYSDGEFELGDNDRKLLTGLAEAGTDHRKYMRMIPVLVDITAPIFWWKEFDTYKIGTTRNSCSTMHKIHSNPFTIDDFSHEGCDTVDYAREELDHLIDICERLRNDFNETKDKKYWRALIEILPENYNMRSTVTLNYENLRNMYHARKNHKLIEWHVLCDWIENLPYSELITGECNEEKIYSFEFCGHHGEVYVPANASETEINAAIFKEMSRIVDVDVKYEWTVEKKN